MTLSMILLSLWLTYVFGLPQKSLSSPSRNQHAGTVDGEDGIEGLCAYVLQELESPWQACSFTARSSVCLARRSLREGPSQPLPL